MSAQDPAIDLPHVAYPREGKTDLQLTANDVEHCGHAVLPSRSERIQERLADQAGACAEREGLEDILTRLDATIEQHFTTTTHGIDDFRENRDGRRSAIQLSPTMIGNDQRIDTEGTGRSSILSVQNAFDDELARPGAANPIEVLPGHSRIELRGDPGGQSGEIAARPLHQSV